MLDHQPAQHYRRRLPARLTLQAFNIREPEIWPGVAVGQCFMIQPKQGQDRGIRRLSICLNHGHWPCDPKSFQRCVVYFVCVRL